MVIRPDTKDWTWVLSMPCAACGLAAGDVDPRAVAPTIRGHADRWRGALARSDSAIRHQSEVWSVIEYACHVRDMYDLFFVRFHLMLDTDDPLFANWDQDVAAVEGDYASADPDRVADEIGASIERVADLLDAVDGPAWRRPGRRSNGSEFTVATLAQYMLHDDVHHLHDVGA